MKFYCLVALALLAVPALAAETFETRLAPSPLTDGTRINVTGEGVARASLDGNTLTISGDFHGLAGNATTAELYDGLGIGIMGPKAFDLTVTPSMAGMLSGSVTLTAKQAAALRGGHTSMCRSTARKRPTAISPAGSCRPIPISPPTSRWPVLACCPSSM